jgi:CRP-like cAMP-binding protein
MPAKGENAGSSRDGTPLSAAAARSSPELDESGPMLISDAHALAPVKSLLRACALFAELAEAELERLADATQLVEHAAGSFIFRRGESGPGLMVLVSGVVEVGIEREHGQWLLLSTFRAGDFFGEMALFDGGVRSASALAVTSSRVLAIAGEGLIAQLTPQLTKRMLSEIAARVRRTDAALAQASDNVARAAHSSLSSAVAVELDAIKTMYRRTEYVAADVMQRAEQAAARADARANDIKREIHSTWSLLMTRGAPLAAVLGIALTWFGVDSISGLKDKLQELKRLYADVKQKSSEVSAIHKRLRVVQETMVDLRQVREAVGLDRPIDTRERLQRAALNHDHAQRELFERYFVSGDNGPRYERFEPEVVFEAVDMYVTLVMGGAHDGSLQLSTSERSALLSALGYVLAQAPDLRDAGDSQAAALLDGKVRDMLAFALEDADATQRGELRAALSAALNGTSSERARDNLAIALARQGATSAAVWSALDHMLHDSKPRRAAAGALALAQLGDRRGLASLRKQMQRGSDDVAYAAASLLAEQGSQSLARIWHGSAQRGAASQFLHEIERVLNEHVPRNCLEERYARLLATCLETPGACGTNPSSELGGECTRYAQLAH